MIFYVCELGQFCVKTQILVGFFFCLLKMFLTFILSFLYSFLLFLFSLYITKAANIGFCQLFYTPSMQKKYEQLFHQTTFIRNQTQKQSCIPSVKLSSLVLFYSVLHPPHQRLFEAFLQVRTQSILLPALGSLKFLTKYITY